MLEILCHLWRHKLRTSLTVLAISVGVFAVVAVGGIAENLDAVVVRPAIERAHGRVAVWPEEWDRPMSEATLRRLRRIEGVACVAATIADRIEEVEGMQFRPRMFSGTRSDLPALAYEPPVGVGLWAGRVPEPGSRTETVVSWDIAREDDLAVGDAFVIRDYSFRVVGIWERVESEVNPAAFISYEVAERLATLRWYSYPGVGRVTVFPRAGVDPELLADRIRTEMDGVEVQSPQEAEEKERQDVLMITLVIGAGGAMATLIGAFTIVNTMAVSVHERRREIGLKKALGASDAHVLVEIVMEAATIGAAGGGLGLLAAAAVGLLSNRVLLDQLGMRFFLLTPRLAVTALFSTVFVGAVAGLYPAWQAARLDPVVSLRGGGRDAPARKGLYRLVDSIRRNARAVLTVGGVAVGVFALVVLGSLAEYLNHYMDDAVTAGRHKVYVRPESGDVPFGRSTARVVRQVPGVRDVVLTRWGGYLDEPAGGVGEHSFYGIESPTGEFGWELLDEPRFAQGRNLTPGSRSEVVVGAGLAEGRDLRVGSTLVIQDHAFTVVGVRARIPRDFGEANYAAHITLDALARVLEQPDPFNRITALVAPGYDVQAVTRDVEAALPGVETMTVSGYVGEMRSILAILFAVMAGLLSIAVFVGGVSVVNTMIIAVHRRTREIGLKKAVGAEDADVLAEVLLDAAGYGVLGGVIGVAAAGLAVIVINAFARSAAGFVIVELTPRLAVAAVVLSTLLGMAAGVLPAWRAARLDPVVALRTE